MRPHILILGGHGKIAQHLTPLLLSKSHTVTSLIRSSSQTATLLALAKPVPTGKLEFKIASLADVKSEADAREILDDVKPEWVIWAAGAGGKGGPALTYAIDRDACSYFIRACIAMPLISKFILISALSSRRGRAAWWDDEDWEVVQKLNTELIPDYAKAKIVADEVLTVLGEERMAKEGKERFGYLIVRPGLLADGEPTGKVKLGHSKASGEITRKDVAATLVELVEKDVTGWVDMLNGDDSIESEVGRINSEGEEGKSLVGEGLEGMGARVLGYGLGG